MHSAQYPKNPIFSDNLKPSAQRMLSLFGLIVCLVSLGGAYYLQYQKGIEPCALCILQRGIYMALGLIFLLHAFSGRAPHWLSKCFAFLTGLVAAMGIGLAGRQVWLEHLPPGEVPSCTASIDRLMDMYPLLEVLKQVLATAGECGEVMMRIFGLSLAQWSLVIFEFLFLISLYQWRQASLKVPA